MWVRFPPALPIFAGMWILVCHPRVMIWLFLIEHAGSIPASAIFMLKMTNSNRKKAEQLGVPFGTANGRLKKKILFHLVVACGRDTCYRCKKKITSKDDLSIEHKTPWIDSEKPVDLFFDIDNIAFSHMSCNISAARKITKRKHPSVSSYRRGCRCEECKNLEKIRRRSQRARGIKAR